MLTLLIIIGSLIFLYFAIAFIIINKRRPKRFRGKLKPLERNIFKELENKLGAPAGKLIPEQISYLKRGQRLHFPKSYTLELHQDKKKPLPDIILFERRDAFTLATLSFTAGETKYKAEINAHAGRVDGIIVRPNPKSILSRSIKVFDKFKLNNDPMEKLDLKIQTEYYSPGEKFSGLLGKIASDHVLLEVQKPLPQNQKELILKLSETKFPVDFIDLCNQSNGFRSDRVQVFGLGHMEDLALEDDNYLIIAEKEGGCLTIRKTKRKTEFKYLSYDDETDIRNLGSEFMAALNSFTRIT